MSTERRTTFQCYTCKETFDRVEDWDPQKEYEENYPEDAKRGVEKVAVCDDCYKTLRAGGVIVVPK